MSPLQQVLKSKLRFCSKFQHHYVPCKRRKSTQCHFSLALTCIPNSPSFLPGFSYALTIHRPSGTAYQFWNSSATKVDEGRNLVGWCRGRVGLGVFQLLTPSQGKGVIRILVRKRARKTQSFIFHPRPARGSTSEGFAGRIKGPRRLNGWSYNDYRQCLQRANKKAMVMCRKKVESRRLTWPAT